MVVIVNVWLLHLGMLKLSSVLRCHEGSVCFHFELGGVLVVVNHGPWFLVAHSLIVRSRRAVVSNCYAALGILKSYLSACHGSVVAC